MRISRMYRIFVKIFDSISIVIFLAMGTSVFMQVIFRYVLRIAVPWTEELAKILLVFMTFLGGAIVSRKGQHLGAYFLRDRAKGRIKGLMFLGASLIVLGVLLVMIKGGIDMAKLTWDTTAVTISFFRTAYIYIGMLVGVVLMTGYALRDLMVSLYILKTGVSKHLKDGLSSPIREEDTLC